MSRAYTLNDIRKELDKIKKDVKEVGSFSTLPVLIELLDDFCRELIHYRADLEDRLRELEHESKF